MSNAECIPCPELLRTGVGGREEGRETKPNIFGVSPPKRPFSFWDHDTVKIFCGRWLQDIFSSISATHDKIILHGGVRLFCFLFLPVLSIVNSVSVPVVASEY